MAATEQLQQTEVPSIFIPPNGASPLEGEVHFYPIKGLWMGTAYAGAAFAVFFYWSWSAFLIYVLSCSVVLCLGHSLGMHRRFIHRSYECPLWLEYAFVYLGVLVGLAGPLGMLRTHDTRDWAQRQPRCHSYLSHASGFWKDGYWQIFCTLRLTLPPMFEPKKQIATDRFYTWLERTWMAQQLPWLALLYWAGGTEWMLWGGFARLATTVTGHWLIGYFAHNHGPQSWHVQGAGVQGYDVPFVGWLTMGESWHNNHHAFPGSAKLGLYPGQSDPGWWVLMALKRIGLVRHIRLPADLPHRSNLKRLAKTETRQCALCAWLFGEAT